MRDSAFLVIYNDRHWYHCHRLRFHRHYQNHYHIHRYIITVFIVITTAINIVITVTIVVVAVSVDIVITVTSIVIAMVVAQKLDTTNEKKVSGRAWGLHDYGSEVGILSMVRGAGIMKQFWVWYGG